jgi:hypothetical protein
LSPRVKASSGRARPGAELPAGLWQSFRLGIDFFWRRTSLAKHHAGVRFAVGDLRPLPIAACLGPAANLAEADISHVMQLVLDRPMAADQLQQRCWSSALDLPVWVWSRQARHEAPHLAVGKPLVWCVRACRPATRHASRTTSRKSTHGARSADPAAQQTEGRLLRRGLEEQRDMQQQARLVAFEDHHINHRRR